MADPQENPQNILLGGGIHPIDLILWAVDSPVDFLDLLEGKVANPIPSKAGANNVAVCEAGLNAARAG